MDNVTTTYTSAGQSVTLTANVNAFQLPVGEGQVQFTLTGTGLSPVTANVGGGVATTTVNLPATLNVGSYSINAAYTDTNTNPIYNPSSSTGTLTLQTAARLPDRIRHQQPRQLQQ